MIAVAALIVLLLGVMLWRFRQGKKPALDYRTLVYTGLIWLVIGLPSSLAPVWIMGLVFIAVGLLKRNEWPKK